MSLLSMVLPENAQGKLKETYDMFPEEIGVPEPLLVMSASPGLACEVQGSLIRYYSDHPNLGWNLMAYIRYLAAVEFDYTYCNDFNFNLLIAWGLSEDEAAALVNNPESAKLDEKDKAMFLFVVSALRSPDDVSARDLEPLRELGWTDSDIYNALFHGASLSGLGMMHRAFGK